MKAEKEESPPLKRPWGLVPVSLSVCCILDLESRDRSLGALRVSPERFEDHPESEWSSRGLRPQTK